MPVLEELLFCMDGGGGGVLPHNNNEDEDRLSRRIRGDELLGAVVSDVVV